MKLELPLNQILCGDCRRVMAVFPADSIDLVVTSPPYWGLRDYGAPPLVYGGDPECDHQWDETIFLPKKEGGIKSSTLGDETWDNSKSDESVARSIKRSFVDESKSNFCVKCGAWRGQLGLEPHPQMFIDHIVEISNEIKRVIKPRGSFWLNLGDTYCGSGKGRGSGDWVKNSKNLYSDPDATHPKPIKLEKTNWLQTKQLLGIPWRIAIALQNEGWILRNCVIWYKPNHMPESVKDRLTKSYEFFFFFVKQQKYHFNLDRIRVPHAPSGIERAKYPLSDWKGIEKTETEIGRVIDNGWLQTKGNPDKKILKLNPKGKNPGDTIKRMALSMGARSPNTSRPDYQSNNPRASAYKKAEELTKHEIATDRIGDFSYDDPLHVRALHPKGKNPGDFWEINTVPFTGAHFAVFPPDLIEPIIKAACPKKGVVLDPFAGSGTALRVARKLGRRFIGIDVSQEYAEMCERRVRSDTYTPPPEGVIPLTEAFSNKELLSE